jgi:formylmethanofuran dehydrogenase subunit E
MECKQCGKDLAGEDYKMVAEWPFCPDCFQQLMKKPAKKVESETETVAEPETQPEEKDVAVEVVLQQPEQKCTLCGKEIEGDQYKKVGIWLFCPDCHLDMAPRPKPPPPPEPEEEPVDEEEEAAMRARFRVRFMHRLKCVECGRMIAEGGSRQVDGEPYCPDCYYALPEEVRQAQEEAEAAEMEGEEAEAAEMSREIEAPEKPSEVEAVPGCESCGQKVPEESLQTVEGFSICQACLSADAEMALHLARARHQKRLQRLQEELEE